MPEIPITLNQFHQSRWGKLKDRVVNKIDQKGTKNEIKTPTVVATSEKKKTEVKKITPVKKAPIKPSGRPIEQVLVGSWNALKQIPEKQGRGIVNIYDKLRFPKLTTEEQKVNDKVHVFLKKYQKEIGWGVTGVEAAAVTYGVVKGLQYLKNRRARGMPSVIPQYTDNRTTVDLVAERLRSQRKLRRMRQAQHGKKRKRTGTRDGLVTDGMTRIKSRMSPRLRETSQQIFEEKRRSKRLNVSLEPDHVAIGADRVQVRSDGMQGATFGANDTLQKVHKESQNIPRRPDLTKIPLDALMRIDHAVNTMSNEQARAFVGDVLVGGEALWDEFIALGGRDPVDTRQMKEGVEVNFSFANKIWKSHRSTEPLDDALPKALMDKAYELAPLAQGDRMTQFMDFVEDQSGLKVRKLSKALGQEGKDYMDFLNIFEFGFRREPKISYAQRTLDTFGESVLSTLHAAIPEVVGLPKMQPNALAAMIADFVDRKNLGSGVVSNLEKAKAATEMVEKLALVNEAFFEHIIESLGEATMEMDVDTRTRALVDILTADILTKLQLPDLLQRLHV